MEHFDIIDERRDFTSIAFDNKLDHMHLEKVNNIADYIVQLIQRRYTRTFAGKATLWRGWKNINRKLSQANINRIISSKGLD